jgi:hypothetical protein
VVDARALDTASAALQSAVLHALDFNGVTVKVL